MFDKILVPLDGSRLAERALEPALALGRGREVVFLRALEAEPVLVRTPARHTPKEALEIAPEAGQARAEANLYLNALWKARAQPDLSLSILMEEGEPAQVIVDTAAQEKVDLIVMSTHGYSGLTRWMYGSVTEKVLGVAPCPVLVVRSPEPIRKILIPLDGSELSEQALAPGLEVASRLEADLTLLHAAAREAVDENEIQKLELAEPGLGELLRGGSFRTAEAYLQTTLRMLPQAALNITAEVTHEPAAGHIVEYAEAHGVDLIVMATHGRTGVRRWVYGSVTEKVLRSGCCSMLIVRPADYS